MTVMITIRRKREWRNQEGDERNRRAGERGREKMKNLTQSVMTDYCLFFLIHR